MASRARRRAAVVFSHAARTWAVPLFSLWVSLAVVRLHSDVLWGEFVHYLIWVSLTVMILNWGSGEYLLRAFSVSPGRVKSLWQANVATRTPLLLLSAGLFVGVFGLDVTSMGLLLWMAGWFVTQSLDVILIYNKKFTSGLIAEVCAFSVVLTGIFQWGEGLTAQVLVLLYALASVVRVSVLSMVWWRHAWSEWTWHWKPDELTGAVPLLFLGVSGYIHSRLDLFLVDAWLVPKDVAVYQLFSGFCLHVQAFALVVLRPYAKYLYRLPLPSIRRVIRFSAFSGAAIVPAAMIAILVLLSYGYGFSLDRDWVLFGALITWPAFVLVPIGYVVLRFHRERWMIGVNMASFTINGVANLLLIGDWGLKGALCATALAQLFLLISFWGFWVLRWREWNRT